MGLARFEIAPCVLARPSQERGQVLRKLLSSQPVESGQPQRVLRWPKVPWTGTGRLSLSVKHQKELQEITLSLALPRPVAMFTGRWQWTGNGKCNPPQWTPWKNEVLPHKKLGFVAGRCRFEILRVDAIACHQYRKIAVASGSSTTSAICTFSRPSSWQEPVQCTEYSATSCEKQGKQ